MKVSEFGKLSPRQQTALLIAMHVRNEREDFHADNLSDSQMKELNQITLKAIYEALGFIDQKSVKDGEYLVTLIPDYWEIPE